MSGIDNVGLDHGTWSMSVSVGFDQTTCLEVIDYIKHFLISCW
jgi:hypothetical protein